MKTKIYSFLSMLICFSFLELKAQNPETLDPNEPGLSIDEVINHLYANTNITDSSEGGLIKRVQFFENFWKDRATKNIASEPNMFAKYYKGLRDDLIHRQSNSCNPSGFSGEWRTLGPDSLPSQTMGYVNCVWADPTDSSYILAGTWGGLFRSTDAGKNWECITDDSPITGGVVYVSSIAVNPLNKNNIYIGTASSAGITSVSVPNLSGPFGVGMLKSSDGGESWEQEVIPKYNDWGDSIEMIQRVYITPDSGRIYAFHGNRIYTRPNIGTPNWQEITPPNVSNASNFYDLEFVPGNQNHFFVSNGVKTGFCQASIWEATVPVPGLNDWKRVTANLSDTVRSINPMEGYVVPNGNQWIMIDISIPSGDSLYALLMAEDKGLLSYNPYMGIYKYNISDLTPNWLRVTNIIPWDRNPSWSTMSMEVSKANTTANNNKRNIYIGTDIPFQSFDGGKTFTPIGRYLGNPTHADIRGIYIQQASNSLRGINDRVYFANDGGVSLKPAGIDALNHNSLSTININGSGLTCGHFWSAATSEAGGLVLAGAMHNGTHAYEPKQDPKWFNIPTAFAPTTGDTYSTMFDKHDRSIGYVLYGYGRYNRQPTQAANGRTMGSFAGTTQYPNEGKILAPPMASDNFNRHYTGQTNLSTQSSPQSSWTPIQNIGVTGLPLNTPKDTLIQDLAFNPNNAAYHGYVLYNKHKNDPAPFSFLYYRDPSASNSNFVRLDSLPAVRYYPITCITTDPNQVERAWYGMGGVHYGNTAPSRNRVYYTPDAGQTWLDISQGLPLHVPVAQLAYYEVDDILFCATDVGIYKCDMSGFTSDSTVITATYPTSSHNVSHGYNNSVEWSCFNTGISSGLDFPNTYVTDLNINYCSGELIAATYGRSIWASKITDETTTPGFEKFISSNETWNLTRYLHGSIRIKSGATLTISGAGTSIFMPKNALIVIEPNARLIVNDATITNGCDQSLWGGIRMEGDRNQVQSPLYQPLVELNNAHIENAIVAVANYDADKSFNSTGGIIKATNTTFLNNEKAVDLSYYHKLPITFVKPYQAQFTQCTFDINDDYKFDNGNGYTGSNPHRFFSHVSLYEVDGVRFNGCSFRNSNTGQYQAWGEGIFSSNAGFSATAYCTSPTIPCNPADLEKNTFIGFKHGIWAEHDNLLNNFPIKVDQAAFDSCSIGIRMKHQFISHLTRNEFIIGNGKEIDINTFDCHKNIGIFVTSTEAPSIEDNDMTGVSHAAQDPDHENIGIVVENTRGADIRVYKNKLQSLHKGCLALGSNDSPMYHYLNNSKGLQFLCNEFNNNENDLYISGEAYEGIADHQGSLQSDAGNTFQGTSANHIANYASPFVYYYDGISGSNQPTLISTSSFVNVLASNASNDCPSHFDPAGGSNWNVPLSAGDLTGMKADFAVIRQGKSDAITTLDGFIDQGNTPGLLSYIENCLPHEAIDLRDSLLTIAPYVSEEALRAAAEKNIMTGGDLFTVLKANPDVLKSEDFLKHLENGIPAPFTPEEVNTLRAESAVSTGRTTMEAAIADYAQQMNLYANEIVAHYSLDTSDVDKDSIPLWYDQMNTVQAEYAKATFYTGTGDYSSAESVLSNLPNKFELNEEALSDHEAYYATWQVAKAVLDDGRNTLQMNATELSDLQAIANSGINSTGRSIYTIDVITEQIGPSYRLACPNLILMGEGRIKAANTSSALSETSVHAYPNPANTQVRFDYTGNQNAQLEILLSNASGQEVYRSTLNQLSGSIHLDISTLSPGVYSYQLRDSGKILQSEKLIISR
jgi:hypothetical protein